MNSSSIKGVLLVLLSAIVFGAMPFFAFHLNKEGINSTCLVFYRSAFSLILLLIILKLKGCPILPNREDFFKIMLLGLGAALTPLLLFNSYNHLSSGTATAIHFSYPLFVLLGNWIFFKQKPSLIENICILLTMIGLLLISNFSMSTSIQGFLLSIGSAITFAFYVLYLDRSKMAIVNPYKLQFYMNTFTSLFMLIYCSATDQLVTPRSNQGWYLAIAFSLVVVFGATIPFQLGIRKIGAQKASILSTAEPISSLLFGVILLGERFNITQLLAIAIIIMASTIIASQT